MGKSRKAGSSGPAPDRSKALNATLTRRALRSAPALIYVFDVEQGRVVFQNRGLGSLLGNDEGDKHADAADWRSSLHAGDAKRLSQHDRRLRAIRDKEIAQFEFSVRDGKGELRWFAAHEVVLSRSRDEASLCTVGAITDVTLQKRAQEHKDVLLEEMQHRTRNLTILIDAIARQSLPKGEPETELYYRAVMARLRALFTAAEIVMSSSGRVADLGKILEATVAPFRGNAAGRIVLSGPPIQTQEEAAASLALAVHELATNAMKYGALSVANGSVTLAWHVSEGSEPRLEIEWKERGGPIVLTPDHEGFGGRVIRHAASREKDGRVSLQFDPDGLLCRIGFAISR